MEELLKLILEKVSRIENRMDDLEKESVRAREQQIMFENNILREMKALTETQLVALERWDKNECTATAL